MLDRENNNVLSFKHGVRPVIYAPAGGYIEFADAIEHIEADIPSVLAGFCTDTEPTFYTGMDPIDLITRYADCVDHIYFKNVDIAVFKLTVPFQTWRKSGIT